VVAKVEWHPGELYPRVGFIVTNLARGADRVVVFYNQRGTAEQYIKEGKSAVKWTRLSCRPMLTTTRQTCFGSDGQFASGSCESHVFCVDQAALLPNWSVKERLKAPARADPLA